MASILGEHLIRDNTTGVLELIKNGYDADAETVLVELNNLTDPDRTVIVIRDDGTGMDEATIKGPWSEPAHGGKQQEKDKLRRTKKGRLPLGEKGVGRFATQKLGRRLLMVTRPQKGDAEYSVSIDWRSFDKTDVYMDQVEFPFAKHSPPQVFTGKAHGTRLEITEAVTPWKKTNVERLQASLIRLLSPDRNVKNFSVVLKCPEYPELENLDKGDILEKFQFKIDCSVDKTGIGSYQYWARKPDGKIEQRDENDINLWARVNAEWQKYPPLCGPFRTIIYAWLRPVENLKNYGLTRQKLDVLCGVSIYRDGFRIVPYGDMGDDWLGLDLRRTNSPGQKYGNNQLIGQVEVTQEFNRNLVDKTSREGLQENQAFSDMRDLVLGVLSLIETESLEERNRASTPAQSTKTLKTQVAELKKTVKELQDAAATSVIQPGSTPAQQDEDEVAGADKPSEATIAIPREKLNSLEEQTVKVETYVNDVISELSSTKEERREAFLHLMGIGLAAERFTHEFDRLVAGLSANLKSLESIQSHNTSVKALRNIFDALRNEVALLGAARYVRRPPENQNVKVREMVDMAIKSHSSYIEDSNIQVEIPSGADFDAKISVASISQVLDNIIANACYWLNGKSEINDRKLHIAIDPQDKSIVISNNGPPIAPNIKRALFQGPFVTSKPDGRGLGLYIVKEILDRNNAEINFLAEDDPRNKFGRTAFMVSFISN
jgi:signal transduction histidine kinase